MKKNFYLIGISSFFIFLLFNILNPTDSFYYDSGLYWNLANSFIVDKKLHLFNFPNVYRGYFYPFLLSIFLVIGNFFGNMNIGLIILNSLMSSMIILLLYLILNKGSYLTVRKLIVASIMSSVFLIYFFKDLVLYPLSDIPAFAMFTGAVYLLKKCVLKYNVEKNTKYIFSILSSGILMYASYNTRTIYLYSCIVLTIYFLSQSFFSCKDNLKRIIVYVLILLFGISLVAIPQALINKIHTNTYSPKVMTESYSDDNQNLFLMQLNWGITFSKYETYVGTNNQYSSAALQFKDSAGEKIIELEGSYPESIAEWFKLVLKYPLDFIGIYTRHLITYITPTYSETYITNLNINKSGMILMNMILFIIAGFSVFVNSKTRAMDKNYDKKKSLYDNIWIWIALLPCLFIIPGAPEVRFFIPLHIIIYVYVCFFVDFKKCLAAFKSNPIFYSFIFLIIIMVWMAIIGGILAHPADANYIFTIK